VPSLEIVAHTINATLATWLGATVFVRGLNRGSPRVFAWLMVLLATWSTAIVLQRFAPDEFVQVRLNMVEDAAAFLLPAAALHIILALTVEGPTRGAFRIALVLGYGAGLLAGLQAISDPGHPIAFADPNLVIPPLTGAQVALVWMVARMLILILAITIGTRAFRAARGDHARRMQTGAALAAVTVASIGGTLRFLPEDLGGPVWLGVGFVAAGTVIATYGVLSQGIFLAPLAAQVAFRTTMAAAVAIIALVGFLYLVNAASEAVFGASIPILTALIVVVAIAVVGPAREWMSRRVEGGDSPQTDAYRRLQRAIDPLALASQRPEQAIQPAIERIARILGLSGAIVRGSDSATVAAVGEVSPGAALSLPLGPPSSPFGEATFGPKASGADLSVRERAFLGEAAEFFASALRLGDRQQAQATVITELADQRRAVADAATRLEAALTAREPGVTSLRVYALGPFRVEVDGVEVRQWGGPKAGSRQAEAAFAFLFDRGERGVTKDEMVEVIWPDVDLEHADLAFHRTLVGLRGILEPGRPPHQASRAVVFHNDRYRLAPELIAWSDVAEFDNLLAGTDDERDIVERYEEARRLYRGDFLDDCPFYGDSAYVEERRTLVRGRCIDLLVALGERYARQEHRPAAADAFRQALAISGDDCPPATAGLQRLGVVA